MIIGGDREKVIANIKQAIEKRDFSAKVEIGDPVMSLEERTELVNKFWQNQHSLNGKVNDAVGRSFFSLLTKFLTKTTTFTGLDHLMDLPKGGAIVTANHFNQIDSMPVNHLAHKMHHELVMAIEDTNLKLSGVLSYLMNYVGTIPLVNSPSYVGHEFPKHLHDALDQDKWVLIYPEQEMWWNYRKPRKFLRGAYYFAVKQNVPVISTFIEIQTIPKLEKNYTDFYRTKYIVHVLPTIYPDVTLNINESSKKMMLQDYQQKVAAYEQFYHKKLDYTFTPWDIAGWKPKKALSDK